MTRTPLPGAPKNAKPRYRGQERFSDGDFGVTDWTADLALSVARSRYGEAATRKERVEQFRTLIDDGLLPGAAVGALVKAGWAELDD